MTPVAEALRTLSLAPPKSMHSLSGDHLQEVRLVALGDGTRVVCKLVYGSKHRERLTCEHVGLNRIASTQTVRVPEVIGLVDLDDVSVLIMEFLPEGSDGDWARAGRDLADMHAHQVEHTYGTDMDFYIGCTRFKGGRDDNWCQWLIVYCLKPLIRNCRDGGHLTRGQVALVERAVDQLPRRIPRDPGPSLTHGDLWRGNMHVMPDRSVALIDPACIVADPMVDMAMATLFGGVPDEFERSWLECRGDEPARKERMAAGQLLHLLNHVHLFGRTYVSGVLDRASLLI